LGVGLLVALTPLWSGFFELGLGLARLAEAAALGLREWLFEGD
jgi:hypothetical protein